MEIFDEARLEKYEEESYGWAIFKNVGKVGWVLGRAGGNGRVFCKVDGPDQPAKLVGTCSLTQLTIGFQFGGQVYSEIVFFKTQQDFEEFASGNFEFEAQAQVTAITASANAKASTLGNSSGASGGKKNACVADSGYTNGMAVFTITKGGLMYEASVGGQKIGYKEIRLQ